MTPLDTARTAAGKLPDAALRNDLRAAERDWQDYARFDDYPGGNPWADHRDAALAEYLSIKGEIARVVSDTGMAPMQAYYHVQGREAARQLDERKRRVGGL